MGNWDYEIYIFSEHDTCRTYKGKARDRKEMEFIASTLPNPFLGDYKYCIKPLNESE